MHGAHPSHLAFKLLDLLSLSPYFSPSTLRPCSRVRRRACRSPFRTCFNCTCAAAASGTFLPPSSASAQLFPSLFVSSNILAPPTVRRISRLRHWISRSAAYTIPSYPPYFLFRLVAGKGGRHRDKDAHVLPCYPRERRPWRRDDGCDLLADKYLRPY